MKKVEKSLVGVWEGSIGYEKRNEFRNEMGDEVWGRLWVLVIVRLCRVILGGFGGLRVRGYKNYRLCYEGLDY